MSESPGSPEQYGIWGALIAGILLAYRTINHFLPLPRRHHDHTIGERLMRLETQLTAIHLGMADIKMDVHEIRTSMMKGRN